MTSREAHSLSLFTSDRERRLWAWTLAVVVAIYSTLGLARTLAGALSDKGLLDAVFGLGRLHCWVGSTKASRRYCPTGSTTYATSASTLSRDCWRLPRSSHSGEPSNEGWFIRRVGDERITEAWTILTDPYGFDEFWAD
jgi:hypothetical protein